MNAQKRLGWAASCLLLVVACSGSDTKTTPAAAAPARQADVDHVRAELKPVLDASCSWAFKCCSAGELATQLGPATADDCSQRLIQSATLNYAYGLSGEQVAQNLLSVLNFVQFGFEYSNLTIDTAAIATCAAKLGADACNPAPPTDHCEPSAAPSSDDPCQLEKLFVGKLAAGADCDSTNLNECQTGFFCRQVSGQRGVCIAKPAVGDLCGRDDDCGEFVCDWGTGKCVSGAASGEACSFADADHPAPGTESIRCKPGLACDTQTLKCTDANCASGGRCSQDHDCPADVHCVMNLCGPQKKAGETCYNSNDCENGDCEYDQVAQKQVCLSPKADGAACQQTKDCESGYCAFSVSPPVCAHDQADGMPCMSGDGNECKSGKCIAANCVAVKAGDKCTVDGDCAPVHDLYCQASKCAKAPFANGATCINNQQCTSTLCLDGTCTALAKVGAKCGTADLASCVAGSFCDIPDGKTAGTCSAKKNDGDSCTRDIECVNSCSPNRGQLRCQGLLPGTAVCSGT